MRCIHPHRSLGGLSISGRSARRRGKEKDCTFGDTAASNGDDNKDVKWRSGPPRPVHLQPPHGRQLGGAVQGTVLGVNPSSPLRDSTFEIRQRDRRQRGLLACMGRWKISSSANFRTSLTGHAFALCNPCNNLSSATRLSPTASGVRSAQRRAELRDLTSILALRLG